ncbi:hypothetical protein [Halorussus halobius]|uniref:hypothetical protein n=1 Tax=Halorussus halobius TaxID=1710537 RepID=UPI001091A03E|nr:hypothetical protein [Halorussus halobius]
MNAAFAAGIVLTVAGLAGYAVGVTVAYPGRAFSVTGVMVGVTLLSVGRGSAWADPDEASPEGESLDQGGDSA